MSATEWLLLGWCGLLLFLLVAAVRDWWHVRECGYCDAAREAVRRLHPNWHVYSVRPFAHRAVEPARVVVAVFYREPDVITEPPPYLLVAVSHDRARCEIIPDELPYKILGRK